MSKLKKLWNKLKADKNILLVAACLLAAVTISISVIGNFDKKVQQNPENQSYIDSLSNKIVSVIQKIDGCGRADVVYPAPRKAVANMPTIQNLKQWAKPQRQQLH